MKKNVSVSSGEGLLAVTAEASCIGNDILVCLYGGSRPHIGAAALAFPCQDDGCGVTAWASVLGAPGHRDDTVAHRLAMNLCKATGRPVCMTAGIHIDHASGEEITHLLRNAEDATLKLAALLKGALP